MALSRKPAIASMSGQFDECVGYTQQVRLNPVVELATRAEAFATARVPDPTRYAG